MISYTVESMSHEFHAMRCEWDQKNGKWSLAGELVGSDMDPVEALRKLIELENNQ